MSSSPKQTFFNLIDQADAEEGFHSYIMDIWCGQLKSRIGLESGMEIYSHIKSSDGSVLTVDLKCNSLDQKTYVDWMKTREASDDLKDKYTNQIIPIQKIITLFKDYY